MVKNYLIRAFVFVFCLPAAGFSQETTVVPQPENANSCPNYAMPIIKPDIDRQTSTTLVPTGNVDYKLIIINPCVTPTVEKPNPLLPETPLLENGMRPPFNLTAPNAAWPRLDYPRPETLPAPFKPI